MAANRLAMLYDPVVCRDSSLFFVEERSIDDRNGLTLMVEKRRNEVTKSYEWTSCEFYGPCPGFLTRGLD